MGGSCACVTGGSIGRGVGYSGSGGGPGLVGSTTGWIGCPGGMGNASDMGGFCVVGFSVTKEEHCCVGSPMVPGGQSHTGRWSCILHSAYGPQMPRTHTS